MCQQTSSTSSFASSGDTTPDSTSLTPLDLPTIPQLPKEGPLQVICQARTRIPTPYGRFYLHVYHNNIDDKEHLALVFSEHIRSSSLNKSWPGDNNIRRIVRGASSDHHKLEKSTNSSLEGPILMRIHSECFTGETVSSLRCDCGEQLERSIKMMSQEKSGVILYLRQEGRGIGLLEKMRAYNLQDLGYDTVDANLLLGLPVDNREYQIGAAILKDLGIESVRLLTNNPKKIDQLQASGIQVKNQVSMIPKEWETGNSNTSKILENVLPLTLSHPFQSEVDNYLRTKISRMGHMLHPPGL